MLLCVFFFVKQKTAYEMRSSDWSSDVCSSDLVLFRQLVHAQDRDDVLQRLVFLQRFLNAAGGLVMLLPDDARLQHAAGRIERVDRRIDAELRNRAVEVGRRVQVSEGRSEEHTSELQSLMRISYAVFCLKKKKNAI